MHTRLTGDALVLHAEMPRHFPVQGLQLKHQVLVTQLLLKRRIGPAGLTHQQTQHPQQKTKFHAYSLRRKMNGWAV
ncbi:hypothetical protein D3C76_1091990 [compost metagenome]